jgi:hypothetical protein
MKERIFDKVRFEVGDIVRGKNPDNRLHNNEIVVKEELINNLDGFTYSILHFESDNKNDFHIAYEYEPFNAKERAEYYAIWKQDVGKKKSKPKAKPKAKGTKVLKL